MLITDMGLPEWQMKKVLSDYRRLERISEVLASESHAPFFDLISFLENMFPAIAQEYAKMVEHGEYGEDYFQIKELVRSDAPDDEVLEILLGEMELPPECEGEDE